jgi:hypothetical protein
MAGPGTVADVVADAPVREERVVLEHEADATLFRIEVDTLGAVVKDGAVENHAASARSLETRYDVEAGALPGAIGPEEYEDLSAAHFERYLERE